MSGRLPPAVWPVVAGGLWAAIVVATAWRARPPRRVRSLVPERPPRSDPAAGRSSGPGALAASAVAFAEAGGRRLRRAAGRAADPPQDRRLGVAVTGAAMTAVVRPWLGVATGAALWGVPWALQARRGRRQSQRVVDELPDAVDLLRLALGSGYSLRLAVEVVAARAGGCVGAALGAVRARLERGASVADALGELERLGPAAAPLLDALRAADRHGAPLRPLLGRIAADARLTRRRRAEERARRVPVKLLFPLVFCTLPAFGLLTVVPLLASALGRLSL